jgi:hypothetical protein
MVGVDLCLNMVLDRLGVAAFYCDLALCARPFSTIDAA